MQRTVTFERKQVLSQQIRDMKVGAQLYFPAANPDSIKAMASRIGLSYKPRRVYSTQKEKTGVVMWRDA